MAREPVGLDPNGTPVYLKEMWPANDEIRSLVDASRLSPLLAVNELLTVFFRKFRESVRRAQCPEAVESLPVALAIGDICHKAVDRTYVRRINVGFAYQKTGHEA